MIATAPFVPLTKQVAAHLGFPDLRIIAIGHPLGASDEATVRGFADAVVDQALELLAGDAPSTPTSTEHDGITEIRSLLQADGGDVTVTSIADGVVEMRLELRDASCADCVLPRPTLEAMSLNILQRSDPSIHKVRIDDPREDTDDGHHD